MLNRAMTSVLVSAMALPLHAQAPATAPGSPMVTVIRAGQLIDPESGTAAANQVIVIEGERIKAVGTNLPIPQGAEVVDLSRLVVLPGLVDAHTHMALTYKEFPENNIYYYTYIQDSTPMRAIQADDRRNERGFAAGSPPDERGFAAGSPPGRVNIPLDYPTLSTSTTRWPEGHGGGTTRMAPEARDQVASDLSGLRACAPPLRDAPSAPPADPGSSKRLRGHGCVGYSGSVW